VKMAADDGTESTVAVAAAKVGHLSPGNPPARKSHSGHLPQYLTLTVTCRGQVFPMFFFREGVGVCRLSYSFPLFSRETALLLWACGTWTLNTITIGSLGRCSDHPGTGGNLVDAVVPPG